MKKRLFVKNAWYNSLLNYIPKPIKTVGGVKDKIMVFLKTNTTEDYNKPKRVNNVYGGEKKTRKPKAKQKQAVDNMIQNERWRNFSGKKEKIKQNNQIQNNQKCLKFFGTRRKRLLQTIKRGKSWL